MYEVVVATFPDHLGLQSKLGDTLYKAYTTSLQLSLAQPYRDCRAVELFLKHWMNDSLRRAWVSLENAGVDITEDLVAKLFQNLISPFGNQVPFSCIPCTGYGFVWRSATTRVDTGASSDTTGQTRKGGLRRKGNKGNPWWKE